MVREGGAEPARASRRTWVALAILGLALVALRAHTYAEPLEHDITVYALIGQELLHGGQLYSEVWDHKPPAVYVTYALAVGLLGCNPAAVFLLSIGAGLATMLGLYAAGSAGPGGSTSGLWAAAAWVVASGDLPLQGNQPNSESFILACTVWGFALLLREPPDASWPRVLGTAALWALATLFKHVAVFIAAPLIVAHALLPRPGVERRVQVRRAAATAAVGVGSWLLLGAYFAARGRFDAMWEALFVYNRYYAGSVGQNLVEHLRTPLPSISLESLFPLLAAPALGVLFWWGRPTRRGWLLGIYLVGSYAAIAAPAHTFMHYYQLWLAPLILASAWSLAHPRAPRLLRVALLGLLIALQARWYVQYDAFAWSVKKYGPAYCFDPEAGASIDRLLRPEERLFVWGSSTGLYFYSGRRPPTGTMWSEFLLQGPGHEERAAQALARLREAPPELLVLTRPLPAGTAIGEWLRATYVEPRRPLGHPAFAFRVRAGGPLQARLDR